MWGWSEFSIINFLFLCICSFYFDASPAFFFIFSHEKYNFIWNENNECIMNSLSVLSTKLFVTTLMLS